MIDPNDFEAAAPPSDDDLRRVSTLVVLLRQQTREVEDLEATLKQAKEALRSTEEKDLPEALMAVGYLPPSKPLIAGLQLEFTEKVQCGQLDDGPEKKDKRPRADRLAGIRWLEDNEHGDLMKRKIEVVFGKDSETDAAEILELIRSHRAANSFKVDTSRLVIWNTLAGFVKEQLDNNADIPLELLGAAIVRRVKIKEEK